MFFLLLRPEFFILLLLSEGELEEYEELVKGEEEKLPRIYLLSGTFVITGTCLLHPIVLIFPINFKWLLDGIKF